ncbi:MAG: hypothetical protein KAS38_06950 [Anaerolineales bacterium]|jgi:hypothetical protein|nr:hypothetical protein [Anaerolineales bacterium]MCK5429962.1 hypothetical protein [Anaerolineales bacterium]
MKSDQQIWQAWADKLHRWGLGYWVASFLEAAGPLTTIGAQAVYMSQPFLNLALRHDHMKALASMLEEPERTKTFAAFLREENN